MHKKDKVFNKEKFAALLDKAKGERTINKYAKEADISAAHISRFLRQKIDSPPTPETIGKLSAKAHNNVSYVDLMIAAGHIDVDSIGKPLLNNFVAHDSRKKRRFSNISPYERRQELEAAERELTQVILAHLYKVDFPWNIKKPETAKLFKQNLVVDIDYEGYKKWIFEFRASLYNRTVMFLLHNIYGQLVMKDIKPTEKITIVVNTEDSFDLFFRRPPKSLRANLYVMLIDLEKGEIVKEEKLCSYDQK